MNQALYDRLRAEQEKYKGWLLSQSPEEILNHTYEYTVREDILLLFENNELPDKQADALLRHGTSLADLYKSFGQIDTGYMETLQNLIENEANDLIAEEEKLRTAPIYYQSAQYARENGELEQYRESHKANIACKEAIQTAIANHYHDNWLDPAGAKEVTDKFGFQRTFLVLANTVRLKDWDQRFSRSNREWAGTVFVPEDKSPMGDSRNASFCVESHSTLVDGFISQTREQYMLTQPLSSKEVEAEADRITAILRNTQEPNSPSGTHFMAELSPQFLRRAGTKDMERLGRLIPFKTLAFSGMSEQKGIFALISNKESRHQAVAKSSALDKLKEPVRAKSQRQKKPTEPER